MLPFNRKRFFFQMILVAVAVAILFLFARTMTILHNETTTTTQFGITFSTTYASSLGLDPEKTYSDLIDNLHVKFIRLPVYWSMIEPQKDVYDWKQLDTFVHEAEAKQVKLTLAIGEKVPRWPECYTPNWAQALDQDAREKETVNMMQTVVNRYKHSSAVVRWQVENEPFFPFGLCEQIRTKDLKEQIQTVRALDSRPVQLTVSGEFEPWQHASKFADIVGFSLYRKSWNPTFGYVVYPIPPEFYALRTALTQDDNKHVIISELQAEPWFSEPIDSESLDHWYQSFSAVDFANNVSFARETHVGEVYLWGAEWWEYLKLHGDNRLWKEAETVFK